jgi:hypothetical protein
VPPSWKTEFGLPFSKVMSLLTTVRVRLPFAGTVTFEHTAGVMAFLGLQSMLLLLRIEVRTGTGEGRLAFADAVHVEGVLAGRQSLERHLEAHPGGRLRERDRAASAILRSAVADGACGVAGFGAAIAKVIEPASINGGCREIAHFTVSFWLANIRQHRVSRMLVPGIRVEGASNNDVFARDCAPMRFASDFQR